MGWGWWEGCGVVCERIEVDEEVVGEGSWKGVRRGLELGLGGEGSW